MSLFRPEALEAQQTSALGRILLFTPRISTFLVAFICFVTVLLIAYSIRHFRQLYENASELPASTSRRSSTLPRQATPSTLVSSPATCKTPTRRHAAALATGSPPSSSSTRTRLSRQNIASSRGKPRVIAGHAAAGQGGGMGIYIHTR